jgi:exosome complex component RRP40
MAALESVLPGDIVPASHPNLKLGPGLVQISKATGEKLVLATRGGELKHTANGRNWWVEANSKRVRKQYYSILEERKWIRH